MPERSAMGLVYGGTPVPYTVSWSLEDADWSVRPCPSSRRPAICQAVAPGQGKPRFGKPHSQRQREAIASELCDLCGKSMKAKTKVSLSHARVRLNGVDGPCIMQVEPLLHRKCAEISMGFCPSLRRDIADGTLHIRQVNRYRPQFAIMDEVYVESVTGRAQKAVGHAKVELLSWTDRDEDWLHWNVS